MALPLLFVGYGSEALAAILGISSIVALGYYLGDTIAKTAAEIKALAQVKKMTQQEDPQIHKPWDFLQNFQNGVKRGTSNKGKTYYYIRDTVHGDMDVYRSTGSKEYIGAASLAGGPIYRVQPKMKGKTFKP